MAKIKSMKKKAASGREFVVKKKRKEKRGMDEEREIGKDMRRPIGFIYGDRQWLSGWRATGRDCLEGGTMGVK